uniref:Uncharacterized protein n=1 Tax=Anguilla anguilla TaxID=7936 RepID=A0A0E9UG41_ANGAN
MYSTLSTVQYVLMLWAALTSCLLGKSRMFL